MLVSFYELPDEARIWIYPSDRSFKKKEIIEIQKELTIFLGNWTAHSQSLEAGFILPHDRFIVIGINQESAQASGCSIDSSVRFIQDLERKFEIILLDKMNVTFKQGDYFVHKQLKDFRKMAKSKSITKETIVYNNLVDNKGDFLKYWEIPASQSWHSRFMS